MKFKRTYALGLFELLLLPFFEGSKRSGSEGWAPREVKKFLVFRLANRGVKQFNCRAERAPESRNSGLFLWQEILLPVYTTTKEACQKHTDAITRWPWSRRTR